MTGYIKICGLTRPDQVEELVQCGTDAIGINLIPSSKRAVSRGVAAELVQAIREHSQRARRRVECVGLVAPGAGRGAGVEVQALQAELEFDRVQLHTPEPGQLSAELGNPRWAVFAARIGSAADVQHCATWPGDPLLVDALVPGSLGGTGHAFDWQLVSELSAQRSLILAGGLTPANVATAIMTVRPWGVDVASGVEAGEPGIKDLARSAAFVRAARDAFAAQVRK